MEHRYNPRNPTTHYKLQSPQETQYPRAFHIRALPAYQTTAQQYFTALARNVVTHKRRAQYTKDTALSPDTHVAIDLIAIAALLAVASLIVEISKRKP